MPLNIRFLTLEEVREIHVDQIDRYGGSHGVRDEGLLGSAVAQPEAGFGDRYLHPSLFEMAAAYLYHIVMNHPFVDGNKRTGLATALIFLELNEWGLDPKLDSPGKSGETPLESLVKSVATGHVQKKELAKFFEENCQPFTPKGSPGSK